MNAAEAAASAQNWWYIAVKRPPENVMAYRLARVQSGAFELLQVENLTTTKYSDRQSACDALRQLTNNGQAWTLEFRYVTVMPRQAFFTVTLDAQGKVAQVSEPEPAD